MRSVAQVRHNNWCFSFLCLCGSWSLSGQVRPIPSPVLPPHLSLMSSSSSPESCSCHIVSLSHIINRRLGYNWSLEFFTRINCYKFPARFQSCLCSAVVLGSLFIIFLLRLPGCRLLSPASVLSWFSWSKLCYPPLIQSVSHGFCIVQAQIL